MTRHPMMNFVAAQLGWFACVWSAAKLQPLAGVAVALLVIGWHLYSAATPRFEAALLVFAAAFGAAFDSLAVGYGWVRYPSGTFIEGVAPYWLIIMWPLFATTLNVSMAWLKGRPMLAAVLGAVFGPLAYRAGAALGAVEFIQPAPAYLLLATGWAIAMPLLLTVAARLDGSVRPSAATKPILEGHPHG